MDNGKMCPADGSLNACGEKIKKRKQDACTTLKTRHMD